MMRKTLLLILLSSVFATMKAQTGNVLYDRIIRQTMLFPQEKAYISTDADSYQPGGRISFHVFLVNAMTHQEDSLSNYVYTELIDSNRVVMSRVRILRNESGFTGYIDIPVDAAKGHYLLRSYTRNMQNVEGYDCLKSIFVGGRARILPSAENPSVKAKGVNCNNNLAIKRDKDFIKVSVLDIKDPVKTPLHLLGHCRSMPFYFGEISSQKPLLLRNDSLPDGVLSFILLDAGFNSLDEKLIFSQQGKDVCPVKIMLKPTGGQSADPIEGIITAPNLHKDELMNVVVRVSKATVDSPATHSNILSEFLLASDMAGNKEEPASVLSPETADSLLQGAHWLRYDMPSVIRGTCKRASKDRESSACIRGRVLQLIRNKGVEGASVNLISPNKGFFAVTTTDATGRFCFEGMDYPEGTQYVLNAFNKAGKPAVRLQLDEETFPPFTAQLPPYRWIKSNNTSDDDSLLYKKNGSILLTGVDIVSHRPTYASRSDAYARTADFSFGLRDIESIGATCLHELLRRVPGLTVEMDKCYVRSGATIHGRKPAAIAIDGTFMNEDFDLDNIQLSDVERVDVFKTGSTAIWGAIGGMGVISITTKKGGFEPKAMRKSNTKTFTTLGYQPSQPYTPTWQTPFWNPSLRGQSVRFSLPSTCRSGYRVIVEGMTTDGRIIFGEMTF